MKNELIKRIGIFVCLLIAVDCLSAGNFPVEIRINPSTGAISELTLKGDNRSMNWVVKTDGTQYPWVKDNYGWGLGYFTAVKGKETVKREWRVPVEISPDGMKVLYREGDIRILVEREIKQGDLVEEYFFTNEGEEPVSLYDVAIYTPFNDNYPDAQQCINSRAHTHIWKGGSAAYVNAIRMGAFTPHLGLVVTNGAIRNYEIWERGRKRQTHRQEVLLHWIYRIYCCSREKAIHWSGISLLTMGMMISAVSFWKKGVYLYLVINMCLRKERKSVWNVGVWNL